MSDRLETPILLLLFNRLETTKKVFAAVRNARPSRLYVAIDGPRDRPAEKDIVQSIQDFILSNIDWNCDVKTLFREKNLGCKYAVSSAIDWFFCNEKMGIILEDDCVPHTTFFMYCEWALNTFENDQNIWHINGNNFNAPDSIFDNIGVGYTSIPQVWGWATWADRWRSYQVSPFWLEEEVKEKNGNYQLSFMARISQLMHLDSLKDGMNTWDYQWQLTVLNAGGLVICPRENQIINIGDGIDATHTIGDSRTNLPVKDFTDFKPTYKVRLNKNLTKWYEGQMRLRKIKPVVQYLLIDSFLKLKAFCKKYFIWFFFGYSNKIVVASSGRSGSTMLHEAITDGLLSHRYKLFSKSIFLRKFAQCYVDTIGSIRNSCSPIIKTHDIYSVNSHDNIKYIFVYGDPVSSIGSASKMKNEMGEIWLEKHIYHLRSKYFIHDLLCKDVLNYENQLVSWFSSREDNMLLVHYNDLWDLQQRISKFVGYKVRLPERVLRTKANKLNIEIELITKLKSIERKFIQKNISFYEEISRPRISIRNK